MLAQSVIKNKSCNESSLMQAYFLERCPVPEVLIEVSETACTRVGELARSIVSDQEVKILSIHLELWLGRHYPRARALTWCAGRLAYL